MARLPLRRCFPAGRDAARTARAAGRCDGIQAKKAGFLLLGTPKPHPSVLRPGNQVPRTGAAYAATARGARLSLAIVQFDPVTAESHRAKGYTFTRPSILFRPHGNPFGKELVEPPGTAPGSGPLISCPFIAIASCEASGVYSISRACASPRIRSCRLAFGGGARAPRRCREAGRRNRRSAVRPSTAARPRRPDALRCRRRTALR